MKRWVIAALALAGLLVATADASYLNQGNRFPAAINVGASGTDITQIRVYSQSLTPAATAALVQTVEQTFTVTGLATTDKVYINGPVPTSLCPPVTVRVSALDTLAIGFTTLTAVACTPAGGTYNIVAVRS